jgi:putative hydrolase of the HAD superfamily
MTPTDPETIRARCQPLTPWPTGWVPQGDRLKDVKVILFDVYGTLLISRSGDIDAAVGADPEAAAQEAARSVGVESPAGIAAALKNAILRQHETSRLAGVDVPEVDIRQIWAEVAATWPVPMRPGEQLDALALAYELRVNPVWPMPGFPEVLVALRDRFRLGLVSNAQFYTPLTLAALAGRPWAQLGFEEPLCAWSYVQRRAKPSGLLWEPVLQHLAAGGIPPAQVVMVGNDVEKDIRPAQAHGCRTILFAGDQRSLRAGEFREQPATGPWDAVMTDLRQWPDWLG